MFSMKSKRTTLSDFGGTMTAVVGNPIRVGLLTTLLLIPALTGCDPTGSSVAGAGETIESQNADDVSASQSLESGDEERCLLYTSPSPRDQRGSRMPSSA